MRMHNALQTIDDAGNHAALWADQLQQHSGVRVADIYRVLAHMTCRFASTGASIARGDALGERIAHVVLGIRLVCRHTIAM